MRNRYYDPKTGRLTQEDPIGLAGGLNLYGFANGDPVSYSDPFGLCPKSVRDKRGRCPGGLSIAQWERIEYAAINRMTPEARDMVLDLLRAGKISSTRGLRSKGQRAAAIASQLPSRVVIAEEAFSIGIGDFAFLLAHEAQHTTQWFMRPGMRDPDAEAFACANTWGVRVTSLELTETCTDRAVVDHHDNITFESRSQHRCRSNSLAPALVPLVVVSAKCRPATYRLRFCESRTQSRGDLVTARPDGAFGESSIAPSLRHVPRRLHGARVV